METHKHHRKKEDYRVRTHMIHGNFDSKKWDYDHHVVPPVSHTTAFRLSSLERGARGFGQFASADEHLSGHVPIYIYDRLEEPTRSMLEENLAYAEGGEIAVTFASGMAGISAALGAALRQGQEVISHRIVYGCTYSLMTNWLPRYRGVGAFRRFPNPANGDVYVLYWFGSVLLSRMLRHANRLSWKRWGCDEGAIPGNSFRRRQKMKGVHSEV